MVATPGTPDVSRIIEYPSIVESASIFVTFACRRGLKTYRRLENSDETDSSKRTSRDVRRSARG
ncbi:hypothetical protein HMPREF0972_01628 [Actinomyces sp. oral taxon 848 str. F0332]|nr:hypothetical protein HMPREF0972_01628 [Actinomyces sp. oral taxon 848 str. F0332]